LGQTVPGVVGVPEVKSTLGASPLLSFGLEEGEGLEAHRPGHERHWNPLQRGVVVPRVAVVEAAREFDLVLGRGELFLQVGECRDRLQVGVVLRDREERA